MVSTLTSPKKSGIPNGEYSLVSWDVDTTGRRLIDEICHIGAYTQNDKFSQYVMPYKDLNVTAKKRHMIRTVTVGQYRMLRDIKSGRVIRTKSEISALNDFLNWLESIRKAEPASSGIILLCHETYELAPLILLEALKRYNLLDRFAGTVKGFANCYAFVKQKCEQSVKTFSLRVLCKVLLNFDKAAVESARNRAQYAYELVQHLCQGMAENTGAGDGTISSKVIVEALSEFTSSIADEEKVIERFKTVLDRQNTLKPIFGPLMKISLYQRRWATNLRRLLAEQLIDYDIIKNTWDEGGSNGKESLNAMIKEKLSGASDQEKEDLLNVLVHYFDPSHPIPNREHSHMRKKNNSLSNGKKVANGRSFTPDTTPTSVSSPSKSNGTVSPGEDSPKHSGNFSQPASPVQ